MRQYETNKFKIRYAFIALLVIVHIFVYFSDFIWSQTLWIPSLFKEVDGWICITNGERIIYIKLHYLLNNNHYIYLYTLLKIKHHSICDNLTQKRQHTDISWFRKKKLYIYIYIWYYKYVRNGIWNKIIFLTYMHLYIK